MIKFYFNLSPNPMKVALALEECRLDYQPMPVDTRKGEQFEPAYLAINPNGKVPALIDGAVRIFDSNAILLYLGEKTGRFIPNDSPSERGELLSWLMFIATGLGPFSGQAVHFRNYAPESPYASKRYEFEARRHYKILEDRLGKTPYILGDEYSIVDMAAWGWSRLLPLIIGDSAWDAFPNVKRFTDEVAMRPAALRASALKDRYVFKTEMDEEARKVMFPQHSVTGQQS